MVDKDKVARTKNDMEELRMYVTHKLADIHDSSIDPAVRVTKNGELVARIH